MEAVRARKGSIRELMGAAPERMDCAVSSGFFAPMRPMRSRRAWGLIGFMKRLCAANLVEREEYSSGGTGGDGSGGLGRVVGGGVRGVEGAEGIFAECFAQRAVFEETGDASGGLGGIGEIEAAAGFGAELAQGLVGAGGEEGELVSQILDNRLNGAGIVDDPEEGGASDLGRFE